MSSIIYIHSVHSSYHLHREAWKKKKKKRTAPVLLRRSQNIVGAGDAGRVVVGKHFCENARENHDRTYITLHRLFWNGSRFQMRKIGF